MLQTDSLSFLPEKNLLTAVLRRALFDVQNGTSAERIAAKEWFFDGASTGPFSFTWVCLHLDVNPEQLLARISKQRSTTGLKRPSLAEAALN